MFRVKELISKKQIHLKNKFCVGKKIINHFLQRQKQ